MKDYMIILIDGEKSFNRIQHSSRIKTSSESGIKWHGLNLTNNFYKNPTANILLNGEKLDAFPQEEKESKNNPTFSIQYCTENPD